MTAHQDLEQMQAYARIDGLWLAVIWTASFVCFVGTFTYPSLATSVLLIGAGSLVFAALRLRRYRDEIREGVLSFRRGFLYSMLNYLYASLLFAMVQYIYFQFLDKGFVIGNYINMVNTDAFKEMAKSYGLSQTDWKIVMDNLSGLRPIEWAMQFFSMNVFMGFFVSVPVAMVMKRSPRNIKSSEFK